MHKTIPESSAIAESYQVSDVWYDSERQIPRWYEALKHLVEYRHLLRFLVTRDLKVRYKRSFLGIGWAIINPLFTSLIMVYVFSSVFSRVDNYAAYFIIGFILWRFFQQTLMISTQGINTNTALLEKIYVPAGVIISAQVLGGVVHFALELLVLVSVLLFLGYVPTVSWLLLPVIGFQLILFTAGFAFIMSALAVFFIDLREILDVVLRAYYFLTPIVYPLSIAPDSLADFQEINPMFYFIDNFRAVTIGSGEVNTFDLLVYPTGVMVISLVVGWWVLTQLEKRFAYYI